MSIMNPVEAADFAIYSEREHQERASLSSGVVLSPAAELRLIRNLVNQADEAWYGLPGDGDDLAFLRKIAAVAHRALEHHGCPVRPVQLRLGLPRGARVTWTTLSGNVFEGTLIEYDSNEAVIQLDDDTQKTVPAG